MAIADPSLSGARAAVEALCHEGVTHVFGLPGTTVMHVLDALAQQEQIRFVATRHEQVAGFMADGYARAGGGLGVCLASRGPGAANLAIALDNAHDESVPVLAVIGQVDDGIVGRGAFEELDLVAFFDPLTKWSVEVHDVARVPELVQRAAQVAVNGRPRPVMVSLPLDVLMAPLPAATYRLPVRVDVPVPSEQAIAAAAEMLAGAQRPVLLVGGGVERTGAALEVAALAGVADAPVVSAWHRKAAFPNSHPAFAGVLGFGAFEVTERAARDADVVVALGCRFSQFTSRRWTLLGADAAVIQVDLDPDELGRTYPPAHALWGDAGRTAGMLAVAVNRIAASAPNRARRLRELHADYESQAVLPDVPGAGTGVGSADVVRGLQHLQRTRDPIFLLDAPTFGIWMQRYLSVDRLRSYYGNAGGAMGWGLPAGMGMQLARPDERVVVVSGDGSFWMVAQDLETAVREDIPVVVIVTNNFAYGNIRDRQRNDHGGRYIGVFYDNPDFAAFARLVGAHGERVERGDQLVPALDRAMAAGRPAVIDVIQDPDEGLPPDVRPPVSGAAVGHRRPGPLTRPPFQAPRDGDPPPGGEE